MATARELLDLIADFVAERQGDGDAAQLQDIAQRFDVTLTDALVDRASVAPEA